ncbi:hypothetical protein PMAYCL1PPCAC_09445, partial [Pristionchus mayeri]
DILLKPTKTERLAEDTIVYQTDDGTKYFLDLKSRLYVMFQGKEINAPLPDSTVYEMFDFEVYGNQLYFIAKNDNGREKTERTWNVYKTSFSPSSGFSVSCFRENLQVRYIGNYDG